jgi:hypothetical protein
MGGNITSENALTLYSAFIPTPEGIHGNDFVGSKVWNKKTIVI